jgi:heme O synthase-like polyprenyltransferase
VLDALFIGLALRLHRHVTPARAGFLFHFSLLYLALLFVALAVDPLV